MIRKRVNMDGSVSWQALVRVKGYPEKVRTFQTKREAKSWERKTKVAIESGAYQDDKVAREKTLSGAIEKYMSDHFFKQKKDWRTIQGHLQWWDQEIGQYSLAFLTPALIAKKRNTLASGITVRGNNRTSATINRYMASLSGVFKVAIEEWRWINESPMKYVRKLKEPNGRIRYLDLEEKERLLKACRVSLNRDLYTIIVFALATGMRKGEILGMKWDDVDITTGRAIVRDPKNGETRPAFFTGHALDLLRERATRKLFRGAFIFPNKKENGPASIDKSWKTAMKKAGVKDFRFHDLRHTAASYMAMSGASLLSLAEFLGHKTLAMVKRYAHLSNEHRSEKVSEMNEMMFGT